MNTLRRTIVDLAWQTTRDELDRLLENDRSHGISTKNHVPWAKRHEPGRKKRVSLDKWYPGKGT